MKATIRERLIRVEQQFLLAVVSNDEESLNIFAQEWSQLTHDIKSVNLVGALDENTALLLSHVSRVIDNMACCMLESGAILQEAQSWSIGQFTPDIPPGDESRVSHHPQEIAPCHLLFSNHPSSTAPVLGQQKLLDSYAYDWLMQNIHDPYPTSIQMQTIGDVSRASVAQVELWFREVRDSIGWTKLSHEFFAGSIDTTLAAARRVYLEGDVNVSFDVVFAFTAVKAFAETLFLKHPPIQAEHVDEDVAQTFSSVGVDLGDPLDGNHIPPATNLPMPPDEEYEMEDTTPPPCVAGCKRPLTEDIYTWQVPGLQRPEKRLRRTSSTNDLSLRNTGNSPCSSPMEALSIEPITTPSLIETPTSSVTVSACLSSPIHSESSLSPPASAPRKREREDFEISSERAAYSLDSSRATRRQKLSDSASPSSPKQSWCPHVISDTSSKVSLPSDAPPTDCGLAPSIFQVPIDLGSPLDLSVYDWSIMPIPWAETAPLTSPLASIYVSGPDLPSLNPLLPDPAGVEQIGATQSTPSCWTSDLGSSEDHSSALQFPVSMCPDLSTASTSLYSGSLPLSLQGNDKRNIEMFFEQFPPVFSQSPSPSQSNASSPAPSTPDNSTLLSVPSPFQGIDADKSTSIWDPSIPPSIFLAEQPVAFHDYEHSMLNLLYGES